MNPFHKWLGPVEVVRASGENHILKQWPMLSEVSTAFLVVRIHIPKMVRCPMVLRIHMELLLDFLGC